MTTFLWQIGFLAAFAVCAYWTLRLATDVWFDWLKPWLHRHGIGSWYAGAMRPLRAVRPGETILTSDELNATFDSLIAGSSVPLAVAAK